MGILYLQHSMLLKQDAMNFISQTFFHCKELIPIFHLLKGQQRSGSFLVVRTYERDERSKSKTTETEKRVLRFFLLLQLLLQKVEVWVGLG